MGLFDRLGRGIMAVGQSLIGSEQPAAPAPSAVHQSIGDFEVRAARRGDGITLEAVLDGRVVVAERRAVASEAEVETVFDQFAEQFRGKERTWRGVLRARAEETFGAVERLEREVREADEAIKEWTRLRSEALAELPGARWDAARTREWTDRVEKRSRPVDEDLVKALVAEGLTADALRASQFPSAWLTAAKLQRGGEWSGFSGSSGPGRSDVSRIVVVRQPDDALRHFAHAPDDRTFYVCVPGDPPGREEAGGPALTPAEASAVAWEFRTVISGVGAGRLPSAVVVVSGERDQRFAAQVQEIATVMALDHERWLPPGAQLSPVVRAPQVLERSAERIAEGAQPPTQGARRLEEKGEKPTVFRVARPLFAMGLTARVIGNPSFGETFIKEAVEELKTGKAGAARVGPVHDQVKRVVFVDRGADAMAYHLIAGERAGSVYVVAGTEPLANVVAMEGVKKVLAADIPVEVAFEAGKALAGR